MLIILENRLPEMCSKKPLWADEEHRSDSHCVPTEQKSKTKSI